MNPNATVVKTRLSTAQPSRKFDGFYDPDFISPGSRDYARAAVKTQAHFKNIKCCPVYGNMFSELAQHSRFTPKFESLDPLPSFLSREWQNYETAAREMLISCRRKYRDPAGCYISGHRYAANRYKFAARPITPNICHDAPPFPFLPQLKYARDVINGDVAEISKFARTSDKMRNSFLDSASRNVSTQTDYRDSETQTMPYSSKYTVTPGTVPKILSLVVLTSEKGLPAGLWEVYMIEKILASRAMEVEVAKGSVDEKWEVKQAFMEADLNCRWIMREKEIQKIQDAQLEVLIQLLKRREGRIKEFSRKRFETVWARELLAKNAAQEKLLRLNHDYNRDLRKLNADSAEKLDISVKHRDISKDYADLGSQVFAPLTRVGYFIDRCAADYEVQNVYNSTYNGLCQLQDRMKCLVNVCLNKPERNATTKTGYLKRKFRYEQMLVDMTEAMNAKKRGPKALAPVASFLMKRREKPLRKYSTLGHEKLQMEEDQEDMAILIIQSVLRGRKAQNLMLEGLDRSAELLLELRDLHAVEQRKSELLDLIRATKKEHEDELHFDNIVDSELSNMDNDSLSRLYDFLSKELVRLQEEQRLHVLSVLIERQRCIREAEEAGRRQIEERRRRERTEIFKQAVKVNQVTLNTHLEDILHSSINDNAEETARVEFEKLAERLDAVAHEMEQRRTLLDSAAIVAELVNSFLLPEVQKEISRQRVRERQQKFLKAAHDEIYKTSAELWQSADARGQDSVNVFSGTDAPSSASEIVAEQEAADHVPISTGGERVPEQEPPSHASHSTGGVGVSVSERDSVGSSISSIAGEDVTK